MVTYLIQLTFLFVFLIILTRSLGKSMISQLTPHDLITIFFLSYIAFSPIKPDGLIQVIVGMIVVALIYILITKLSLLQLFNHLIIGEPTILIKHGKIIKENLKKNRFSLMELLSSLRVSGYPNVADIEYAILEPNGEISVLPKQAISPVTPKVLKDVNIESEYRGLPIVVIVEGRIHYKNLKLIDKNEEWLLKRLQTKGHNDIKKIFFATVQESDHRLDVVMEN